MSNPEEDLHTPVFPEILGLNMPQTFQKGTPGQGKSDTIMLHSVDHPLAFSPTYFSPHLQSLANSPAVNVPLVAVTLLVPLNPVEVDHTVNNGLAAQKDLTLSEKVDMQNEKENHNKIPEKSSIDTTGYLGPYRSDSNFTRGKNLSSVTARSSTHVDQIQTTI